MAESYKLIFIVGPTAVGKSSLAFQLANRHGAVILNADSVQTYKDLNIGTAKPTPTEFEMVPHRLFDIVEPPARLTAGEYFPRARQTLTECLQQQHVFVVGGSGFYIQALEKGMYPVGSSNPDLLAKYQAVLETKGPQKLHDLLRDRDPEHAGSLPVADSYRVLRALVMVESEDRSMAEIQKSFEEKQERHRLKMPFLKVGLTMDREALRERVEARVEDMVANGLKAEVQALLQRGLADWHPLSSVGYKETVESLKGEWPESEWKSRIVTSTMQLAKRQMTWFKRDEAIEWFRLPDERTQSVQRIENYLNSEK